MQKSTKPNTRFIKAIIVASVLFATIGTATLAVSEEGKPSPVSGYGDHGGAAAPVQQSGREAAVEKALAICKTSVDHDQNGQPDRQAVHECMAKKGFNKPPHGDNPPPPPRPKGIKDHSPPHQTEETRPMPGDGVIDDHSPPPQLDQMPSSQQ